MKISDLTNYPLSIVTDINNLQPGEAIACEYTASANKLGEFKNIGNVKKDMIEHPATASAIDGAFLFICVGYTPDGALKLVADRNVQNFITWETLNVSGFCTTAGLDKTDDELSPQIRSRLLQSEEWDIACLGQRFGGEEVDPSMLWNTASSPSWTVNTGAVAANRVLRGGTSPAAKTEHVSTGMAGFRPVMLYNPTPRIYHRPDEDTICPLPLVTDISKICIGEAIACEYMAAASKVGTFTNLGTAVKPFISDLAPEAPNGTFHFICTGYTPMGLVKLIADRNVQGKISWEILDQAGFCTMDGGEAGLTDARIRLPHTVSARHVDEETCGEWDVLLSSYNLDRGIVPSDNAIWNCASTQSWTLGCLDTVDDAGTTAASTLRIARGMQDKDHLALRQFKYNSSTAAARVGFRPVLLYDPRPKRYHRPDEETVCPLPLVSDLSKIQPGEAIACEYSAKVGKEGVFANLGTAEKSLISDLAPEAPDGMFYFICIGYTPAGDLKLVADRNLQGNISWETLNQAGYCTMNGVQALPGYSDTYLRLPHTVVDRLVEDASGEWDAIISYCDLAGKIVPSHNIVWNCLETQSWTLATLSTVDEAGTLAASTLRIARGGQDKDHFVLRQAKYDSAAMHARVGFRPVMTVRRRAYYLYRKEDDRCYKVVNDTLEKVADAWTELTQEEKRAMFLCASQTLAEKESLQSLGKFQILGYTEANAMGATKYHLRFTPKDQLMKMRQLYSVEVLRRALLTANLLRHGNCKALVTANSIIYYGYDFAKGEWKMVQLADIAAIQSFGIDAARLEEVPFGAWNALTSHKVGFAFLLSIENSGETCEIDRLNISY